MKVIDIMQKVANREIFKFRIDDVNYYVDKSNYICEEDGTKVEWFIDDEWLNMDAEIIEEDKKIKKIKIIEDCADTGINGEYIPYKQFRVVATKINEIIDKINEDK